MSDYKRLVSYIYSYPGGERDKNVGFVKAEVRNGQFKLSISLKGVYTDVPETFGVYLMVDKDNDVDGRFTLIKIGDIIVKSGIGNFTSIMNPQNIDNSMYTFHDVEGVAIANPSNQYYMMFSMWGDYEVNPAAINFAPKGFQKGMDIRKRHSDEDMEQPAQEDNSDNMNPGERNENVTSPEERDARQMMPDRRDSGENSGENSDMGSDMDSGMNNDMNSDMDSDMDSSRRSDMGSDMNSGMNDDMGSDMGSDMDSGMNDDMDSDMGSDMNSGMNDDMDSDMGSDMNSGMNDDMGSDMGSDMDSGMNDDMESNMNSDRNNDMRSNRDADRNSGMDSDGLIDDINDWECIPRDPERDRKRNPDEYVPDEMNQKSSDLDLDASEAKQLNREEILADDDISDDDTELMKFLTSGDSELSKRRKKEKQKNSKLYVDDNVNYIGRYDETLDDTEQIFENMSARSGSQTQSDGFTKNGLSEEALRRQYEAMQYEENEESDAIVRAAGVDQNRSVNTRQEQQNQYNRQSENFQRQNQRQRQMNQGMQNQRMQYQRMQNQRMQNQQRMQSRQNMQNQKNMQSQQSTQNQQSTQSQQSTQNQQSVQSQQSMQNQQSVQSQNSQQSHSMQSLGRQGQRMQNQNMRNQRMQNRGMRQMNIQATDNGLQNKYPADTKKGREDQVEQKPKNAFEKAFENAEFVDAFDDDYFYDCVEVSPDTLRAFPVEDESIINNSFLIHGYYNYKHILFGRVRENDNNTKYFLGVPGMYCNRERFMASMFGFNSFKKSHRSDYTNPYFGYWYQEL